MDNHKSLHELLLKLEKRLLEPAVRQSPDELDQLLADDFVEFGSSGQVFDRDRIIETIGRGPTPAITISNFQIRTLSPDIILATYRSKSVPSGDAPARRALRSSIWQREGDGWRMVFHQGTPIPSI